MKRFFCLLLAVMAVAPLSAEGPIVKHSVKVEREGTRSESRHGYLVIDGKALPDCFRTAIAEGKRYLFHQRDNLWGDDGYFPVPDLETPETTAEKISANELKRGFTVGEKRKAGTPAGWLYLEWKGGAGFAGPNGIAVLVEAQDLHPIPRFLNEELMKD